MSNALITLLDFNGEKIDGSIKVEPGRTFAETVMTQWPDGLDGTPLVMNPEGETCGEEEAISRIVAEGDEWFITLLPQGAALVVNILIAVAATAVLYLLSPKIPKTQQNSYEWDDSDRPQFFSGQQNAVQPGRRVREAFGNIRVYPDIISAPAIQYNGVNQTIRELYVVSNGSFVPNRQQFFDEDFSDIPNSAITYYYPGQTWPTGFPIMRYNPSINNIELPAENEVISFGLNYQIRGGYIYVERDQYWSQIWSQTGGQFRLTGVHPLNSGPTKITSISANGRYLYVSPAFPVNQDIATGEVSFIGVEWYYQDQWGNPAIVATGDFTLRRQIPGQWPQPDQYVWHSTVSLPYGASNGGLTAVNRDNQNQFAVGIGIFNGQRYLEVVNNGSFRPPGGNYWVVRQTGGGVYNPDLPGTGYGTQAYNVPGRCSSAWLDFEFPTGLYFQTSGNPPQARGVNIDVYYRERIYSDDTTGWVRTVAGYAAKTRTPRRFTHYITFPKVAEWEIYCARLTPFTPDTSDLVVADSVQWTSLGGVQDQTELIGDPLNVTLADVRLNNQGLRATSGDRRFNVTGTRYLWSYRTNTWGPTAQMSDAIMYTLVDQSGVPLQNIDTASLWAIQDELDAQGPNDGEFSAVIDQSMSTQDQVALIAGLSRTIVYRRAGTFYFARPKGGLPISTLVNSRNKLEPENRAFNFSQENDPDAIIIRFQNRDLNYNEDTYQYPEGIAPVNPETQTVLGACDINTIARIAKYSFNQKKYEKDSVSVKMTEEGVLLAPGDVILVTDHLAENAPIDGEIVSASGNTYTFDQAIPVGTYSAKVRDQFGDLAAIATVDITSEGTVQTIAGWGSLIMPSGTYGPNTGLLYSFEEVQYENANRFLVRSISPTRSGEVEVEGVLYREETYQGDVQLAGANSVVKKVDRFDASLFENNNTPDPSIPALGLSVDYPQDVTVQVEEQEAREAAEQEGNQDG